jgi:hypothetical protein
MEEIAEATFQNLSAQNSMILPDKVEINSSAIKSVDVSKVPS